jgi:HK97 family phage major capsid protein
MNTNTQTIDGLKQQRKALVAESRTILDKDDPTPAELVRADECMNQVDVIENKINLDARSLESKQSNRQVPPTQFERASGVVRDLKSGHQIRSYKPDEKLSNAFDDDEPRFGQFLRGKITGRWDGVSDELRAMSEGTDSAGGFLVPNILSDTFYDMVRNRSVAIAAGVQTIPMESDNLTLAKSTADPTVAWKAESAAITAADPTLAAVTLAPKTVVAMTKVSLELWQDGRNIDKIIQTILAGAVAAELDRVVLLGSGTGDEPEGIKNTTGIGSISMGTNGAAVTDFSQLITATRDVQNAAGGLVTGLAAVQAPRTASEYAALTATDNQPLQAPAYLSDLNRLVTSAMPITETQGTATDASTVLLGDFSQVLLGVRSGIVVEASRDAGFSTLEVWVRVHARMDVAIVRADHLVEIIGVIPY